MLLLLLLQWSEVLQSCMCALATDEEELASINSESSCLSIHFFFWKTTLFILDFLKPVYFSFFVS